MSFANAIKPLLALATSWWQVLAIRFVDRFAKGARGTPRDVMVAETVAGGSNWFSLRFDPGDGLRGRHCGSIAGSAHTILPRVGGMRPVFWAAAINAATDTKVTHDSSQKLVGSTLSIGTKVTAPAGGRVVVTANGTVKIKGVRKAVRLTTATASLAAGTSRTLRIAPKGTRNAIKTTLAKLKAALRSRKTVTAIVTISIVDSARHTRVVTRTVQLT